MKNLGKILYGESVNPVCLLISFILIVVIPGKSFGQDMKVERIREFTCDVSSVGAQTDITGVENGGDGEAIFIRPAGNDCYFNLFHRDASGIETLLSNKPGGFTLAQAIVIDDGTRVVCASDAIHSPVPNGEPNERSVASVAIRCWVGTAGHFQQGVTVVGNAPEYAAWVKHIEADPSQASTFQVVWIRDFSFQFLNMSDEGRPSTDGTYATAFTMDKQKIKVGKTVKLTDTTMEGKVTFEISEPTSEEIAAIEKANNAGQPGISATDGKGEPAVAVAMTMTGKPVAGTIKAQPFQLDQATLKNDILEIRQGKDFFPDASVKVFLFLKQGELPDGKSFTVDSTSHFGVPHIHVGVKPPGATLPKNDIIMSGYEMTLVFGKRSNNKLPGSIMLTLPDKYQTMLTGDFEAEIE